MTTQLGDFLISISTAPNAFLPARVMDATRWPRCGDALPALTTIAPSPGISVIYSGDVHCVATGNRGGMGLAREPLSDNNAAANPADAALKSWIGDSNWQPTSHRGRYVFVCWDTKQLSLHAFTDMFRTYPVYYMVTPAQVLCASDLRLILAAVDGPKRVSRAAIYHYLNFAYIPAPHSAVEGVAKLEPGSCLIANAGHADIVRITDAHYPADHTGSDTEETTQLRNQIVKTVSEHLPPASSRWGTFLSGGTDSSSIAGMLATANKGAAVDSFSIGFAEVSFDEMAFSRIAAAHNKLIPHEKIVDENDAVNLIDRMVKGFDEPFGNSSAIPTFYCAELARKEGKDLLIAGDGGDEIYGGNERYAKDQIFGWYHQAPSLVRTLGSTLSKILDKMDWHLTNRISNMIRRGNMPNPDRFYSDDSFASDHFDELLSADFRAEVGRDDSLQIQRDIFARADTESELNRLMYLDLKMTIAESDVVKVVRSAKMAGVDVDFPYLDLDLVNYTGHLLARHKVRLLTKRYLFKCAMIGILPEAILTKKKQGFGLPISVWLSRGGRMHDLVKEVVLSKRALDRGYFYPEFIKQLIERHESGSWDYSSEIFRLLMLELWHREYIDVLTQS